MSLPVTPWRALYISYFGIQEPLVQTQVLPYLRTLREAGYSIHLLTFEPSPGRLGIAATRQEMTAQGIDWRFLRYHKRPSLPATAWDILCGAAAAAHWTRRAGISIIHGRGHIPTAIGAIARFGTSAELLFDIRGFMPEEYVDAGVWPAGGLRFRLAKAVERALFRSADGFVVLTERAREILSTITGPRPVEVIPCCVDPERFSGANGEAARTALGAGGRTVGVYAGALGGWYLTEDLVRLFAAARARDPGAFALVLTQSDPVPLRRGLLAAGLAESDFAVQAVLPGEIPDYLATADYAVSLIKPCYSKLASSPTKLAEYLLAGLPVLCNAGIGDVDELVQGEGVGVVLEQLDEQSLTRGLEQIDLLRAEPGCADRCRQAGLAHFDLTGIGGARYSRLYARLLGAGGQAPAGVPEHPESLHCDRKQ